MGNPEMGDGETGDGQLPENSAPEGSEAQPGNPSPPRRKSRVVLWASLAILVLAAVLVAVLASAKTSNQSSSSPLLGKPAPAVSGPALDGKGNYALSQFSGKWVLVNFAASWCIPCRDEMPQLKTFEAAHAEAGNGLILAVAFDEGDKADLASYLKSQKATWPAVDDASAEISYGVTGIPESYLIDPRGTVVAKYVGGVTAAEVDGFINKVTR
jgi:cytochrome c biogenesis protein CcmG, thiol:disulfide interchange protein DsbE